MICLKYLSPLEPKGYFQPNLVQSTPLMKVIEISSNERTHPFHGELQNRNC